MNKQTLITQLSNIKIKLYENDADHAGDLLGGLMLDLLEADYICRRCGVSLLADHFHDVGDSCGLCTPFVTDS